MYLLICITWCGGNVLVFMTQLLTSSLLRETNLKVRQPLPETSHFGDDSMKLSSFNGNADVKLISVVI